MIVVISSRKDHTFRPQSALTLYVFFASQSTLTTGLAGLLQSLGVQTSLGTGCCSGCSHGMVRITVSFGQERVNAGGPMEWESGLADRPWPIPRHFDTPFLIWGELLR